MSQEINQTRITTSRSSKNLASWHQPHTIFDSYTILIFLIICISSSVNCVVILTYKAGFRNRKSPPVKPKALSEKESQSKFRRRLTETIISVPKSIINTNRNDDYTECLFPNSNNSYIYRRTLCSYFILVLAVCDLFISLVNMPVGLVYQTELIRSKIFTKPTMLSILCPLGYFLYQIPIVLELEILSLIALDRYSSVFRSIDSYFFDKNKFIILIVSSLVFACLISLPNVFLMDGNVTNLSCQTKPLFAKEQKIYQLFLLLVFVINLSIIVTCYVRVYKHIYRTLRTQHLTKESKILYKRRVSCPVDLRISLTQTNRIDYTSNLNAKRFRKISENQMISSTHNSGQNVKAISIRRHTSRKYKHTKTASILALTICVIVLTWSPFWLYKIFTGIAHDESYLLTKIFKNLYLLNYLLNPVFYSFINKRFRKNAVYLAKSFCSSC